MAMDDIREGMPPMIEYTALLSGYPAAGRHYFKTKSRCP